MSSFQREMNGEVDGLGAGFDWQKLAREQDIPLDRAREILRQAVHRTELSIGEPRLLYEALLREQSRQQAAPDPSRSPGTITRSMRLATPHQGKTRTLASPGKRSLTESLPPQPGPAESTTARATVPFQARMEEVFGEDFSHVQVSLGSSAVPAGCDAGRRRGQF